MDDVKYVLSKLTDKQLEDIADYVRASVADKYYKRVAVVADGREDRMIKLQLRAFKRIPSNVLMEYMTEDERGEYEVLIN